MTDLSETGNVLFYSDSYHMAFCGKGGHTGNAYNLLLKKQPWSFPTEHRQHGKKLSIVHVYYPQHN